VKAQELWFEILEAQTETGTPYMLFKDHANRKSNQKHLGTIKSSNLCTEIIEYTAPDEVAVCNLASIALPKFVIDGKFDHQKLYEVTKVVTKNLNKIIDINFYPVPEARNSNMRHRPIGIGVQGLADTFIMLRMPFRIRRSAGPQPRHLRDDLLRRHGGFRGTGQRARRVRKLQGFAALQGHLPVRHVEHGSPSRAAGTGTRCART
jgi:hypothetical protein